VFDDWVPGIVEQFYGTEAEVTICSLGCRINPSSFRTIKGSFLFIVGYPILTELRSDEFQEIAKMSDNREIVEDCVFFLAYIIYKNKCQKSQYPNP